MTGFGLPGCGPGSPVDHEDTSRPAALSKSLLAGNWAVKGFGCADPGYLTRFEASGEYVDESGGGRYEVVGGNRVSFKTVDGQTVGESVKVIDKDHLVFNAGHADEERMRRCPF